MTSKIKVDNINKVSDDSNIIKKCGSTTTVGSGAGNTIVVCGATVTIGRCGGTVALASGATQTGFGRSGSVNWQTSIKTSTFTSANGEGYFVDTSSGAITINLPSASVGDIVAVKDYAGNFQNNALTISPNGTDKIDGINGPKVISTENAVITLVFADSTKGWLNVQNSTDVQGTELIAATGGTVATCGDFKIHTFTGPGTFCVSAGAGPLAEADYLVVAGGGGGNSSVTGGGGGGGGFRYSASTYTSPPCAPGHPLRSTCGLIMSPGPFPITVGGGGVANPAPVCNQKGSDSIFSTITSGGGGGGGNPGGSGGGEQHRGGAGGTGNVPPVSPPQGNDGGASPSPTYAAGGGGGATAAGQDAQPPGPGGPGGTGGAGAGLPTAFGTSGENCGSFYYFSGGGGGGSSSSVTVQGGVGGGGNSGSPATPGTVNTGGGGGGFNSPVQPGTSGSGGSGIVVIRYKFQ